MTIDRRSAYEQLQQRADDVEAKLARMAALLRRMLPWMESVLELEMEDAAEEESSASEDFAVLLKILAEYDAGRGTPVGTRSLAQGIADLTQRVIDAEALLDRMAALLRWVDDQATQYSADGRVEPLRRIRSLLAEYDAGRGQDG